MTDPREVQVADESHRHTTEPFAKEASERRFHRSCLTAPTTDEGASLWGAQIAASFA